MPISTRSLLPIGVVLISQAGPAQAQDALPATTVVAERRSALDTELASWDAAAIGKFAPRGIDELLAQDPAFSLYRRQNASFANPTSSGISLRQTGASAASRSLVLLDGVPQNDPFGGWVPWIRFDPSSLESARIVSAAESSVWGNLSAVGSVQLSSREIRHDEGSIRASVGTQGTYGGSVSYAKLSENGKLAASGHLFTLQSDGFFGLPPEQRGAVDEKLDLDAWGANLRFRYQPTESLSIEPSLSYFSESRGNGTAIAGNQTEAVDLSLRITSASAKSSTQFIGYFQDRDFSARFSAVSDDRSTERLALDQFDVPGRGIGGAIVHERELGAASQLSFGTDFRYLTGETNESVGTFRLRSAGGEQGFFGLFGRLSQHWDSGTQLEASGRLDYWKFSDGERLETSFDGLRLLRFDEFDDRSGWEPSAAIALTQALTSETELRLSAGTSFRAPTLNELYRPFRVRSDVTEANASLDPERFFTLEAGINWQPDDQFELTTSVYHHWIKDAIANVPVTDPAEIARIFDTLPAGGSGAQRQNVDQASVFGLQASAEWNPSAMWTLRLDALYNRTRFTDSRTQPLLDDQPFPQSPTWRLISTIEARPTDTLSLFAQAEFTSLAYDDLQSTRELPEFWNLRLGANWQLSEKFQLTLRVDNLLDTEITTGLASNGLRTIGQPRSIWLETRAEF